MLIPRDPKFVADLIVAAGARRRAELPLSPTELRPAARAALLCGMKRQAEPLTDADAEFLSDFLEEVGAS